MSFIMSNTTARSLEAGYFLADDENCVRKTFTAKADSSDVITMGNGAKVLPIGSIHTHKDASNNTVYDGIVYEDCDVTSGDMPCSVVMSGTVYIERVPAAADASVKSALEAIGIKFINEPK